MTPTEAALAALERVRRQLRHLQYREVKEVATAERVELVQAAAMTLSLLADELRDETGFPHYTPGG